MLQLTRLVKSERTGSPYQEFHGVKTEKASIALAFTFIWCGKRDLNPHELCSPPPQDGVSTNSTTSAKTF
ncbi:hypothetical protein ALT1000_230018 [Alteromonas macleodii]